MMNRSDYQDGEYVMLDGIIGKVDLVGGPGPAPAADELRIVWDVPTPLTTLQKIYVLVDLMI
ncbi:MAG: hypothetical protein U0457_05280 [Candidatus Sericytochromatia bacterium]